MLFCDYLRICGLLSFASEVRKTTGGGGQDGGVVSTSNSGGSSVPLRSRYICISSGFPIFLDGAEAKDHYRLAVD